MVQPLKHASRQSSYIIYRLSGPFTVETAPRVLKGLQSLYHPYLRFISLDMTNVDEVDSSALATLLWSFSKVTERHIQIDIIGAPETLSTLVEIYNLEKMFLVSHN